MNNAIYAAALGARIETFRLDVTANNIANASTPGFKSDTPVFLRHVDTISKPEYGSSRKALKDVTKYFGVSGRFTPGIVQQSGREFDFALDGDGFFTVQTPRGEGYTRAGNFRLDTEGNLVTPAGYPVLGDGGPITVDPAKDLSVSEDGTVFSGGSQVDKLRIVDFSDKRGLKATGLNVYLNTNNTPENPEPRFTVMQGALEGSNVNVMREMSVLVTAGRQFETYTRVIRMADDLNSKTATSLGTV